jgi:hypothetical protein
MLKALILVREPAAHHKATLATFRGQSAHDFEWLRAQLARRGVVIDKAASKALAGVTAWTTHLRYDPGTMKRRDAEEFLESAEAVIAWVNGSV